MECKDPYWEIPDKILGYSSVDYTTVDSTLVVAFEKALEEAKAEADMQKFFESNPVALASLMCLHKPWVIPQVPLQNPLGGGVVPDFLLCDWNSNGASWTIVELESPKETPVNTRGISAICRHAQQQISDFRRYMQTNSSVLSGKGLPLAHQLAKSWIVIGRRAVYSADDRARLAGLLTDNIEVASYDRVLDHCRDMVDIRVTLRRSAEQTLAKMALKVDKKFPLSGPTR